MIAHKAWLLVFILTFLPSCKDGCVNEQNGNNIRQNNMAKHEWLTFIDSTRVYKTISQSVDSVSFCFLRDDAPSTLNKIHVQFWKNGKELNRGECIRGIDGYVGFSIHEYLFYIIRNKSIYFQEVNMGGDFRCLNGKLIDFSGSSCSEVYGLKEDTIIGKTVYLIATMNDICFNRLSDTTLTYKLSK